MTNPGVYLHLFHGRDAVDQDMEDWGFDGPTIGPLRYVHLTYLSDPKIAADEEVIRRFFPDYAAEYDAFALKHSNSNCPFWEEHTMETSNDLIKYAGKFYGDFSVFTEDLKA